MLFNSFAFIFLYLPITALGFFVLARRSQTLAAGWLGLASIVFYGIWDYRYIPLLLASIVFNFAAGYAIGNARPPWRKRMLSGAVVGDLLLLGYFKYANFFVASLSAVTGGDPLHLDVVLPIGISFFTFTQIAFLVDTYQGKVKEYKFVHYVLFVTYFPHLIAGPVLHHKEMMPQFASRKTYLPSAENFAIGITVFVIGLVKKVLIADNVAPLANPIFVPGAHPPLIEAWVGIMAYAMQLYFDFSGYSDMAIGLSRMFGVRLPLNFNSPYKAENIVEFWRRWHMTLSRFLRDYLYVPLGGNRYGLLSRYRNLMLTMLLGGLWHGAGWTFVLWGGLHGLFLVANHLWHSVRNLLGWTRSFGLPGKVISRGITFLAVLMAWGFFRAPDMATALDVLSGISGLNGLSVPAWTQANLAWLAETGLHVRFEGIKWIDFGSVGVPILFLAIALALFAPNTQEIVPDAAPNPLPENAGSPHGRIAWKPSYRWAIFVSLGFLACVLNLNHVTEFLYFQF
jgi:D-alanyl-lipoteichoic acid acyltransferase DltB (MBOAT superfamily)